MPDLEGGLSGRPATDTPDPARPLLDGGRSPRDGGLKIYKFCLNSTKKTRETAILGKQIRRRFLW